MISRNLENFVLKRALKTDQLRYSTLGCKLQSNSTALNGKNTVLHGPLFNSCRHLSTDPVKKVKIPRSISKISLNDSDLQGKAAKYLKISSEQVEIRTCTSVSTCERYDLPRAMDIFHENGIGTAQELLSGDIISAKYPSNTAIGVVDVVVLNHGSVVAWGMTEQQVLEQIIPLLKPAECHSYKHIETEEMDYVEPELDLTYVTQDMENDLIKQTEKGKNSISRSSDKNKSKPGEENALKSNKEHILQSANDLTSKSIDTPSSTLIGDLLIISGERRTLDKAAFSSGLARSTKLAALEHSLEKYILTIKGDSERLASGEMLRLDDRGVLKATGQLLQIRGQLNLYSELIETPDIYWSEPQLENLYSMISRQLDIGHRISIMNKKLDYASEFVGVVKSYTSERSATRLEWMVIVLIAVEVVFETFHTADRLRRKDTSD